MWEGQNNTIELTISDLALIPVCTVCQPTHCDIISLVRCYYTEQKYKCNMWLVLCFTSWNKRSHKFSIRTKSLFLSNVVHKFVYIPVSEHFSFAKIRHPPDRCHISRSWLSVVIAQVHHVLGTIKGHSKMCSFVKQHNATAVSSFEGACNWHADCRNVPQSCFQIIEEVLKIIDVCNEALLWGKTHSDGPGAPVSVPAS